MRLVIAAESHVATMMSWIPDRHSCAIWAGPEFRYPFTDASFRVDIRPHLPSYSLLGEQDELVGFGQYYLRVGRCHLAMLIISPNHRGHAAGAVLIRELSKLGCDKFNVSECSLFVLESNAPAFRLYSRLGFRVVPYPEALPYVEEMVYMTTPASALVSESVPRLI